MSIWKRVVAPTVLVSLVWAGATMGTMYYTGWLNESQTRVLTDNRNLIRAAEEMEESLWRLQAVVLETSLRDALAGAGVREAVDGVRSEEGKDRRGDGVTPPPGRSIGPGTAALEAGFQHALSRAKRCATTRSETELVGHVRERFDAYLDHIHHQPREPARRTAADHAAATEQTVELARAVVKDCRDLLDLGEQATGQAFTRRDRMRVKTNAVRLTFLIAGPAVGILLGIWVARGLHRSISQISVTLRDAQGDLEQDVGRVELVPADTLGALPALQQQVQEVSGRIRQVVEELQQARREAVRAERLAAVGELAAGVAHELRNPLTSVKLLVQTAARRQAEHGLEGRQLQVVEEEIARMETIIQELLDFARPAKLNRLRHDVRDTLRRALNLVGGRAMQQQVEIVEDLPAAPLTVDGDPEQLDQVFINLLLNGIESMPSGGRLAVDAQTVRAAGGPQGRCCIRFRDTGSGIPPRVLERMFEPFVTSKERGIGLGLAISRRIVTRHGGTLEAANQPETGAVFTVELPLAAAPVSVEESADARAVDVAGH